MTLLIFLIILSILIFVHEFGHFIVAKKVGIRVEEFALGFPPRIWSKKLGETIYAINALPIGGYVKLYGEDSPVTVDHHRSYYYKNRLPRIFVTIAGVFMNFLLGVFAFSLIFGIKGIPHEVKTIRIDKVAENSPAQESGIREGDVIIAVNDKEPATASSFVDFINQNRGKEIKITLKRGSESLNVFVTPRINPPPDEGALGVLLQTVKLEKPPFWQLPFLAFWYGIKEAILWTNLIITGVLTTIFQAVQGVVPRGIAGPIGIFQITGVAAQAGVLNLISFVGILSINLAVLNVLPFPALDGGRLLFIGIETIFGRRVLPTVERYAHMIGLAFLLGLMLVITIYDVTRVLNHGFSSFLQ